MNAVKIGFQENAVKLVLMVMESGDNSFWRCDDDRIEEDAINLLKIFRAIIE